MRRRNNMALVNNERTATLNYVFREKYGSLYLALLTSAGEVSGEGYERQLITFVEASNSRISNDAEVHFPVALEDWGDVTKTAIYDDKTDRTKITAAYETATNTINKNKPISMQISEYKKSL